MNKEKSAFFGAGNQLARCACVAFQCFVLGAE
jgi:hypothetical protein